MNPSSEESNVILSNNIATIKTEIIYPFTEITVDNGYACAMSVNLNDLEEATVNEMEVI